ncbi:11884_t:CDS:2 [Gigaspora margarita]|uniref:11884_t:CDS:1 n=1 Tax=Gigaspora margarita TaxID=4874 RepID=A0ABN7V1F9_GIGMA|nr:11884_t:CDS:2 [Gigaspora margarita]
MKLTKQVARERVFNSESNLVKPGYGLIESDLATSLLATILPEK